jgi:hypothetical protein
MIGEEDGVTKFYVRDHTAEELVTTSSGATSSKIPRGIDMIPYESLTRLGERFALGAQKHGRRNYRQGLGDLEFIRERINHAILHGFKLLEKLEGTRAWDGDDDAAAIMWSGAVLCEAVDPLKGMKNA